MKVLKKNEIRSRIEEQLEISGEIIDKVYRAYLLIFENKKRSLKMIEGNKALTEHLGNFFESRDYAMAAARRIFIYTGITRDVSEALSLYNDLFSQVAHPLKISAGSEEKTILDYYQRPICPECDSVLYLRKISIPEGRGNTYGYKTSWICVEGDCVHEEFSTDNISEIISKLPLKVSAGNADI